MIVNFFGISFSSYGPYLLFATALAIFYALLPDKVGQIFMS